MSANLLLVIFLWGTYASECDRASLFLHMRVCVNVSECMHMCMCVLWALCKWFLSGTTKPDSGFGWRDGQAISLYPDNSKLAASPCFIS